MLIISCNCFLRLSIINKSEILCSHFLSKETCHFVIIDSLIWLFVLCPSANSTLCCIRMGAGARVFTIYTLYKFIPCAWPGAWRGASLLDERMSLGMDEQGWLQREVEGSAWRSQFRWGLSRSMTKCADWTSWAEFLHGIVSCRALTSESKDVQGLHSPIGGPQGPAEMTRKARVWSGSLYSIVEKGMGRLGFKSWPCQLGSLWFVSPPQSLSFFMYTHEGTRGR